MAKGKRRVREEIIVIAVIVAIVIFALILGWWQEHAALSWTIIGVLVVLFGFLMYKYPNFRSWVLRKGASASKKVVYTDEAPGREPTREKLYARIMTRANNRCENPACKYQGKPEVHHFTKIIGIIGFGI